MVTLNASISLQAIQRPSSEFHGLSGNLNSSLHQSDSGGLHPKISRTPHVSGTGNTPDSPKKVLRIYPQCLSLVLLVV